MLDHDIAIQAQPHQPAPRRGLVRPGERLDEWVGSGSAAVSVRRADRTPPRGSV